MVSGAFAISFVIRRAQFESANSARFIDTLRSKSRAANPLWRNNLRAQAESERTMVNLAKIERAPQPSPPLPPLLSRALPRASPSSRSSSPRGPSRTAGFSRSQSSQAAGLQCALCSPPSLLWLSSLDSRARSLDREIFCRSVGVQPSLVLANVVPRAAARCLFP